MKRVRETIAFLASGELTRSSGQTARSEVHREARKQCNFVCLGTSGSSVRMRGTWARRRAEQRSVKRLSARREQAKRGAIAFLDALSENRQSNHAICHNTHSCRVLSRHPTPSEVVSPRTELLRQNHLSLHCNTWHLESRLSFSRSRPSARHV